MKCGGCPLMSEHYNGPGELSGKHYCIGSPDHETPEEHKLLVNPEKCHDDLYFVEAEDECVLWHSPRFDKALNEEKKMNNQKEVKVPVIIFYSSSHLEGPEVFELNSDTCMDRFINELRKYAGEGLHQIEKAYWTEEQLKKARVEE